MAAREAQPIPAEAVREVHLRAEPAKAEYPVAEGEQDRHLGLAGFEQRPVLWRTGLGMARLLFAGCPAFGNWVEGEAFAG